MNSNRIITQIDIVLFLKDQLQNKIQIAAYKLNEIGFIFRKIIDTGRLNLEYKR